MLEELPEKVNELKSKYHQKDILETVDQIEKISTVVLQLKEEHEVDLESELFVMLDNLIYLHHKINLE